MSKKHHRIDRNPDTQSICWHKPVLVLLAAVLCLTCGNGCRSGDGEGKQNIPTWGTESSNPTQEVPSLETSLPTESVEPSESTEAIRPPTTTESLPTEPSSEPSTVPPTEPSTQPPTQATTPPVVDTEPPVQTDPTHATEPTQPSVPETVPPMQIQISPDRSEVLLIPERAWGFSRRDMAKPVEDAIYSYKFVNQRLDISVPVTLSVQITNIPQSLKVISITITLADNAQLNNGRVFCLTGNQRRVEVPYLLAGKQYYYQVHIAFSDGTTQTLQTSFRTKATPRLLSVAGIVNVRDIGGWKTTDGYVIRQGLLYRGSELDGVVRPEYKLTTEGLQQMRQELGIRTEMDLRFPDELSKITRPLGEDVPHIMYGAPGYQDVFTDSGQVAVRRIFTDLADRSKYPIYLHCTYGTDRTGTICYLLEALLGVGEVDLQREYELSTMYHTWVDSPGLQRLIAGLKAWEGDTLREKTESYLLDCGVTSKQIAQIREILLEKQ